MSNRSRHTDFSITMVGAGNMGGAMLKGWLADGFPADQVTVIDPAPADVLVQMLSDQSIKLVQSASNASPADVILVAVKPQVMDAVLPDLTRLLNPNSVAISVAAGKTLGSMESGLGDCACVRVMPNTPALVQRGISVAVANAKTNDLQKQRIDYLLSAIGSVCWVDDEKLIDAVTALSGSGPAYAFYLAECMAKAGKELGLPEELAEQLAAETVSGAGELMRQSEDSPAVLRQKVTSPNGTTAAALDVLLRDENGFPDLMLEAMAAAKKRSEELS